MKIKMMNFLMMLVVGGLLWGPSSVSAALVTYDFTGTDMFSGVDMAASITIEDDVLVTAASVVVGALAPFVLDQPILLDLYTAGIVLEVAGNQPVPYDFRLLYEVPDAGSNELYFDNGTDTYMALDLTSSNFNAVPLPGAAWLLGSGLIGLVGLRRKK